jgi:hypothetical protein
MKTLYVCNVPHADDKERSEKDPLIDNDIERGVVFNEGIEIGNSRRRPKV